MCCSFLSLANGRVMAAGKETEAGALIEMAGGLNAAGEIAGYKPLSDEAVIAGKPDLVLVMNTGQHQMTAEQVFAVPALAATPAAAARLCSSWMVFISSASVRARPPPPVIWPPPFIRKR